MRPAAGAVDRNFIQPLGAQLRSPDMLNGLTCRRPAVSQSQPGFTDLIKPDKIPAR